MANQFDNFTERASQAMTEARHEAARLNHHYIGTEHLLLGLLPDEDSVAVQVLTGLGVDRSKMSSTIESIIGRGERPVTGEIEVTPRASKVIALSIDESRLMNSPYVDAEHLLLGLAREGEGLAAGVLESLDASYERIRDETNRIAGQLSPE